RASLGRSPGDRRRERLGQDDAATCSARRARADLRHAPCRRLHGLRRAEPGPGPVRRRSAAGLRGGQRARADRGAYAAGEVRARGGRREARGCAPVARRTHARRSRPARRDRRELPRARRADEPSRPRGDRGARALPRDVRRLPPGRDTRPALPGAAVGDSYHLVVTIEEMKPVDWTACARIYEEGLDVGTFENDVPSWAAWDASHLEAPRLVARGNGAILGWAALAPGSHRFFYP